MPVATGLTSKFTVWNEWVDYSLKFKYTMNCILIVSKNFTDFELKQASEEL